MILFRTYHRLRDTYFGRRKALYEPAIEKVLMEQPLEEIVKALRPKRWGDEAVAQEVVIEAMRHLKGPPFATLNEVAYQLGFIERNLQALRSRDEDGRGGAMDALAVMRSSQAIVVILDILDHEPIHMKLVALSCLAAIGDPAVLPFFVRISDRLSPALMVRLASLMLEFGAPAHKRIEELIKRHPTSFFAASAGPIAQGNIGQPRRRSEPLGLWVNGSMETVLVYYFYS